jgi:hypothetical protein
MILPTPENHSQAYLPATTASAQEPLNTSIHKRIRGLPPLFSLTYYIFDFCIFIGLFPYLCTRFTTLV